MNEHATGHGVNRTIVNSRVCQSSIAAMSGTRPPRRIRGGGLGTRRVRQFCAAAVRIAFPQKWHYYLLHSNISYKEGRVILTSAIGTRNGHLAPLRVKGRNGRFV